MASSSSSSSSSSESFVATVGGGGGGGGGGGDTPAAAHARIVQYLKDCDGGGAALSTLVSVADGHNLLPSTSLADQKALLSVMRATKDAADKASKYDAVGDDEFIKTYSTENDNTLPAAMLKFRAAYKASNGVPANPAALIGGEQRRNAAINLARTLRCPETVYGYDADSPLPLYGPNLVWGASSIRGMNPYEFVPLLVELLGYIDATALFERMKIDPLSVPKNGVWAAEAYGYGGDEPKRLQNRQAELMAMAYTHRELAAGLGVTFVPVQFADGGLPQLMTRVDAVLFRQLMALPVPKE
jgi:hypothetical protein